MKFKPKMTKKIKKHEGDTYIFKNGVAEIPGMRYRSTRKPYTITLKEFEELLRNEK